MRVLLSALLTAALLAASPAAAQAQKCVSPPGTAAIDEYCETQPGVTGARGPDDPGGGGNLPRGTVQKLSSAGADGEALVRATGAQPADPSGAQSGSAGTRRPGAGGRGPGGSDGRGGGAQGDRHTVTPQAPSSNPLSAVTQSVGKGSSIGSGFVIGLLVLTLAMAGWAWVAYRRRSS